MDNPKKLNSEELDKLLEIIERNRWDRLKKRQEENGLVSGSYIGDVQVEADNSSISPDNVKIVLFGTESPFIKSMIEMLRVETVIAFFDDPEKMISFCLDHPVPNLLFDIDPPSDCHLVMDAFASIRMLLPHSRIFVCSSRKGSLEVDYFKMHGANIFDKPILRKQVEKFCKEYCW